MEVDEGVRRDTSLEKLAGLRPAFFEGGTVTAGTSSQISDGAAAVLIMSEEKAAALGLRPRARFHTFAVAANDPQIMLTAPIPATALVLAKSKLKLDDIDSSRSTRPSPRWCWPGSRSSTPTPTGERERRRHRHRSPHRLLGARLMATLLNELERTGGRYGLQTMCEGGGQANATIIERLG